MLELDSITQWTFDNELGHLIEHLKWNKWKAENAALAHSLRAKHWKIRIKSFT